MTPDAPQLLRRAARRARTRSAFLAWVFARFEAMENLSEKSLQERLGGTAAQWPRVQLFLRPRAEHFLKDVTSIANEFGLDRGALAMVIRRVEAIDDLPVDDTPESRGTLLAARTRKRPRPTK